MGICDRLKKARSTKEVDQLMQEANAFEWASKQTVRRWSRLALKAGLRVMRGAVKIDIPKKGGSDAGS